MDTLKINTGEKRLAVSVDGVNGREVVFNPNDVLFIERLHRFYRVANQKAHEWDEQRAAIEKRIADIPLDENGIPESLTEAVEPLAEMNTFMREQIDLVFGEGVAQAVFGETVYHNPAVYIQLIDGIKGYIEPVRAAKVEKYLPKKSKPKAKPKKAKPRKRTK